MASKDDKPTAQAPATQSPAEQPAAPKYDPESATPEEHAVQAGQLLAAMREPVTFNGVHPGPAYTWQHAAAAQLHGWNHHKLHDATPLQISRKAYDAALKAVEAPVPHAVDRTGNRRQLAEGEKPKADESLLHDYVPHGPAVSKHFRSAKEQ